MAKPDKPLLSMGAKGTLGDSLTFTTSHSIDSVRRKPLPAYRRTLSQAYQRWDYQDAISYWRTLTTDQKAAYRATASRRHIPIFASFISDYLATLPDIAGRWHLDELTGTTAYDSGKQANHGTITGTTPVSGQIGYARYFNGVTDRIVIPNSPTTNPTTAITLAILIQFHSIDVLDEFFSKNRTVDTTKTGYALYQWNNLLHFTLGLGAATWETLDFTHVPDLLLSYLICTWNGTTQTTYVDGIYDNSRPCSGVIVPNTHDLTFATSVLLANFTNCTIHHAFVLNRGITAQDARRISQRRYPQ